MRIIRIKQNGALAITLRRVGLTKIVDSPRVRSLLGLPVHANPPISAGPKVSVIIPAFNVSAYLEDAVGTVQRQSYQNLEIVIVNDGSTDDSGAIADRIARKDRRIRVIHKQNGGLGAARNTGLAATSGEYVTFVDSDDQLTPRAIEVLVESLERTGSEFAIGSVERFNSTRRWVPAWVDEVHDVTREGIEADEHPAVLWDVFVWNKLFRRKSWDERVGLFPEGVLYEDQECTARLYVEGARFDSLTHTVYRWRFRDDGTSITQNKHSTEDLEDRLLVARTVRGVLTQSTNDDLLDTWYAKLLGDDLYWYLREVPRAEEEFWVLLRGAVREFHGEASEAAIRTIRFDRRLHILAIAKGNREDFDHVLQHFQEHGATWQTRLTRENGALGSIPALDAMSISLSDAELAVDLTEEPAELHIVRQRLSDDGAVHFDGYVFVKNLEAGETRELTARLCVEPAETEASEGTAADIVIEATDVERKPTRGIPLHIERTEEPAANFLVRDPLTNQALAGFSVTVPASVVAVLAGDLEGEREPVSGVLEISMSEQGIERTSREVRRKSAGSIHRLVAGRVTALGARLDFEAIDGELIVSARNVRFVVEEARLDGERLDVAFRSFAGTEVEPLSVRLQRGSAEVACEPATLGPDGRWHARLDLPRVLPRMKSNYRGTPLEVFQKDEALGFLEADAAGPRVTSSGHYGLFANRRGQLQVERYIQFGEARTADLLDSGRKLRITGVSRLSRQQVRQATPSLMLWRREQTIYPDRIEYIEATGEFTCEFSLTRMDVDGSEIAYPMGTYLFGMMLATGTELASTFTLLASADIVGSFPSELKEGNSRVTLQRRPRDGGLEVNLAAPFEQDERGLYAQAQLTEDYLALRDSNSLKQAVLFETFGGRAVGDSPKAIDAVLAEERPDLERLWTVRDHTVAVPPGAIPVLRYSRSWYEALATSKYLVNNNNFPPFFRKGKGQVYIQTWHGTPLKRVGNDVPSAHLSLGYVSLMKRETEQYWDVLLAQTPWAGEVLANAFGYEGPVITEGYPRNDSLRSEAVDTRREEVRRYLGIAPDQMMVLYAPTWRDNMKSASGAYAQPDFLRPEHLQKTFGNRAVLAIRGHSNHAGQHAVKPEPNAIDVSGYPDINDLFLAGDVLVTDYSSVQFDFINTGKPIIFLAPDIEEYRERVRGFYFDFEDQAPGPILKSSKEVVDALKDLDALREQYADAYSQFKENYAPFDDGAASRRVVKQLFSE